MKSQKHAPMKIATAPFQPIASAYAPARLSESTRARLAAELASDSTKRKIERASKPTQEADKDSPAANADNDSPAFKP